MDMTMDLPVERPRPRAAGAGPRCASPLGRHVSSRPHTDGAPQRWSQARQGSGEVLSVQRPPGRSPVQPLDSFLATGSSHGTAGTQTRGVDRGVRQGLGVSSNQGAS